MFDSYLGAVYAAAPFVPFLIATINFRSLNRDSKVLYAYLIYILLAMMLNLTLIYNVNDHDFPSDVLSRFFIIIMYPAPLIEVVVDFYLLIGKLKNKRVRILLIATSVLSLAMYLVQAVINPHSITLAGRVPALFENISIASVIVLLLKQEYSPTGTLMEYNDPFTWYLLGIIISITDKLFGVLRFDVNNVLNDDTFYHKVGAISTMSMWVSFSIGFSIKRFDKKIHQV